jgi:hypothetical protein
VKRCGGCHGRRTIARRALERDIAPDRPQSRAIEFWYSTGSWYSVDVVSATSAAPALSPAKRATSITAMNSCKGALRATTPR